MLLLDIHTFVAVVSKIVDRILLLDMFFFSVNLMLRFFPFSITTVDTCQHYTPLNDENQNKQAKFLKKRENVMQIVVTYDDEIEKKVKSHCNCTTIMIALLVFPSSPSLNNGEMEESMECE